MLKLTGRRTVLFVDEIQRFNKAQQDSVRSVRSAARSGAYFSSPHSFCPLSRQASSHSSPPPPRTPAFASSASTTLGLADCHADLELALHSGALLSRCRVFILNKLSADDIYQLLVRALRKVLAPTELDSDAAPLPPPANTSSPDPSTSHTPPPPAALPLPGTAGPIDEPLLRFLASAADGDARVALSSLELAITATTGEREGTGPKVGKEELKAQLRKAHLQYDRSGGESSCARLIEKGEGEGSKLTGARPRRSSL